MLDLSQYYGLSMSLYLLSAVFRRPPQALNLCQVCYQQFPIPNGAENTTEDPHQLRQLGTPYVIFIDLFQCQEVGMTPVTPILCIPSSLNLNRRMAPIVVFVSLISIIGVISKYLTIV